MRNLVSRVMLFLLVTSVVTLAFETRTARADGTIYINADGSIYPPTSPISTTDNITYTFTSNIYNSDGIRVERNNTIIDGNGYTLQGLGTASANGFLLSEVINATIKDTVITNFDFGIELDFCSNDTLLNNNIASWLDGILLVWSFDNTVVNNNITSSNQYAIDLGYSSDNIILSNNLVNGNWGILLSWDCSNNIVSQNNIIANVEGIRLIYASSNKIFHNNFIKNTYQTTCDLNSADTWDNGYPSGGNYWSDYSGTDFFSGPYQNVTGSDRIDDTPYVIDANNTDHYPLMIPFSPNSLSVNKAIVGQGFAMYIYFTGATYDDYPETFNVTVYANSIFIASQSATFFSGGSHITFMWNTTGFAYGDYTVSVYAWSVQNDTNTTNGNYTAGNVYVGIPGDIARARDGKVDILDAIVLANAFGTSPSSSNWNPNADINNDGTVNILDAIILASHFLQHYP